MSIVRKIKRDIKRNNDTNCIVQQIYYPNGYKPYAIFLGVLSALMVILIIGLLILIMSDYKNHIFTDYLFLGASLTCLSIVPFYGLVLIWKLSTKRISLSILDKKVILKGVLTTKKINIFDIEVIKRANTKIEAILIKAKKDRGEDSNSKMVIPVIWFGKENIRKFIEIIAIQKLNKKVKIDL